MDNRRFQNKTSSSREGGTREGVWKKCLFSLLFLLLLRTCLLALSPPGSASTSQSINLVWSKACLRLVWLLSAIWLPCYKMANAAQIPNKKNIGLERSENCRRPKTECCHQATLRIRNGCMRKPKQVHVHINWQYIEIQKHPQYWLRQDWPLRRRILKERWRRCCTETFLNNNFNELLSVQ